ncbi:MAG: hypothetical protein KAS25_05405 [Dehalococcoidales bacterium]|nr:hypothetical protein [Dehalococcoidales bacterium]
MKVAISFVSGVIVCSLLLFGANAVIPTLAETDDLGSESENLTQSFMDLLPDIEKIYRESLIMPFEKAESKIYDEDIAEFYGELLDKTGLRSTPDEETN